jgi:hypothetical protein
MQRGGWIWHCGTTSRRLPSQSLIRSGGCRSECGNEEMGSRAGEATGSQAAAEEALGSSDSQEDVGACVGGGTGWLGENGHRFLGSHDEDVGGPEEEKPKKNRPSVRLEWEKTRRTECGTQSTGRGSGIECYFIPRV